VTHDPAHETSGLIKVRGHCLFTWHHVLTNGERWFERRPEHCKACITELERLYGAGVRFVDADEAP